MTHSYRSCTATLPVVRGLNSKAKINVLLFVISGVRVEVVRCAAIELVTLTQLATKEQPKRNCA